MCQDLRTNKNSYGQNMITWGKKKKKDILKGLIIHYYVWSSGTERLILKTNLLVHLTLMRPKPYELMQNKTSRKSSFCNSKVHFQ